MENSVPLGQLIANESGTSFPVVKSPLKDERPTGLLPGSGGEHHQ